MTGNWEQPLGPERDRWPTASKKAGSSVLQPWDEYCNKLGKWILPWSGSYPSWASGEIPVLADTWLSTWRDHEVENPIKPCLDSSLRKTWDSKCVLFKLLSVWSFVMQQWKTNATMEDVTKMEKTVFARVHSRGVTSMAGRTNVMSHLGLGLESSEAGLFIVL